MKPLKAMTSFVSDLAPSLSFASGTGTAGQNTGPGSDTSSTASTPRYRSRGTEGYKTDRIRRLLHRPPLDSVIQAEQEAAEQARLEEEANEDANWALQPLGYVSAHKDWTSTVNEYRWWLYDQERQSTRERLREWKSGTKEWWTDKSGKSRDWARKVKYTAMLRKPPEEEEEEEEEEEDGEEWPDTPEGRGYRVMEWVESGRGGTEGESTETKKSRARGRLRKILKRRKDAETGATSEDGTPDTTATSASTDIATTAPTSTTTASNTEAVTDTSAAPSPSAAPTGATSTALTDTHQTFSLPPSTQQDTSVPPASKDESTSRASTRKSWISSLWGPSHLDRGSDSGRASVPRSSASERTSNKASSTRKGWISSLWGPSHLGDKKGSRRKLSKVANPPPASTTEPETGTDMDNKTSDHMSTLHDLQTPREFAANTGLSVDYHDAGMETSTATDWDDDAEEKEILAAIMAKEEADRARQRSSRPPGASVKNGRGTYGSSALPSLGTVPTSPFGSTDTGRRWDNRLPSTGLSEKNHSDARMSTTTGTGKSLRRSSPYGTGSGAVRTGWPESWASDTDSLLPSTSSIYSSPTRPSRNSHLTRYEAPSATDYSSSRKSSAASRSGLPPPPPPYSRRGTSDWWQDTDGEMSSDDESEFLPVIVRRRSPTRVA